MPLIAEFRRRVGSEDAKGTLIFNVEGAKGHWDTRNKASETPRQRARKHCTLKYNHTADETVFAPRLTPRVAHNPVVARLSVVAPADHADDVVDATTRGVDDALRVRQDLFSVNAARDGACAREGERETLVNILTYVTKGTRSMGPGKQKLKS
jgi:hypothetical protein